MASSSSVVPRDCLMLVNLLLLLLLLSDPTFPFGICPISARSVMSSWTSTSPSMERWLKMTTTKIMTTKTMKMMTMMIKQGWWLWWWWRVPEHQPPYPWRGGHLQILKTTSVTTMMMTKKIMITLLSRTMMTKMIMANINDAIDDNTTAIAGVGPLCWW